MSEPTLRDRLWSATQDALVLGVRVLVFLAVILLGAGWIIGDYTVTRQRAAYAFDVAQKIVAAQQQRPAAKVPEP